MVPLAKATDKTATENEVSIETKGEFAVQFHNGEKQLRQKVNTGVSMMNLLLVNRSTAVEIQLFVATHVILWFSN